MMLKIADGRTTKMGPNDYGAKSWGPRATFNPENLLDSGRLDFLFSVTTAPIVVEPHRHTRRSCERYSFIGRRALSLQREFNQVFTFTMSLLRTCLCLLASLDVLLLGNTGLWTIAVGIGKKWVAGRACDYRTPAI
jgi:hypothetical protein